jgi:16S rRNA (cytosine1402-N4)-methyltransferase
MDPAALHRPVLRAEVLTVLRPQDGFHLLDCTLGLGGHSAAFLAAGAQVTGIDRDAQARALAVERLQRDVPGSAGRLRVLAGTFADQAEALAAQGEQFDGVLADLGVSSLQLDDPLRGFSIRSEEPLDLRMDREHGETALMLIDRLDEAGLADVLWRYGEERLSRVIARHVKALRAQGGGATGLALADAVRAVVRGHQPRHPALRTFQALRIAVNDELGQVERLLAVLPKLLKPGGRAAVISFHSLEDRLVKLAFRAQTEGGHYADTSRKVITASATELAENPRSEPAKLRWAEAPAARQVGSDDAVLAEARAADPGSPEPPPAEPPGHRWRRPEAGADAIAGRLLRRKSR